MMATKPRIFMACALVFGPLLVMCQAHEGRRGGSESVPLDPISDGGQGGVAVVPETPTVNEAGASGEDDPLYSDVFGSGGLSSEPPEVEACDYSTPGCDFSRISGCCSPKACSHASGADVFDTYPVESCQALLDCVQSHPGCSTKDDPLCFQDEAPDAPCLNEGYSASHEDPDGPFAWTAELMACICGY